MNRVLIGIAAVCVFLTSCHKHASYYYRLTGLNLTNVDNSGDAPVVPKDSVSKKAYRFYADFNAHVVRVGPGLDNPNEAAFVNENNVTAVNISCLQQFNPSHPANTSLNDYFLTALSQGATISNLVRYGFGSSATRNGETEDWIDNKSFYLMVPPDTTGNYTFVLQVDFEDGFHLADTTSVYLY